VREDNTIFQYKCDEYYAPQSEGSYIWNDKTFCIDWGIEKKDIILSEKDSKAPSFGQFI
jgi:dTDP-4-dehydrorhamnose 3,5-epimerase